MFSQYLCNCFNICLGGVFFSVRRTTSSKYLIHLFFLPPYLTSSVSMYLCTATFGYILKKMAERCFFYFPTYSFPSISPCLLVLLFASLDTISREVFGLCIAHLYSWIFLLVSCFGSKLDRMLLQDNRTLRICTYLSLVTLIILLF